MPGRLRGWLLFVPVLLLALGLRLQHLDADPPRAISGGPTPNEGLYLLNARNQVVLGHGRLDDWNSTILHPVGTALHSAAFSIDRVGLAPARRLAVFLAAAGLLLFFGLTQRASGSATALLASIFMASSGIHAVYSRQAGSVPVSLLLMFGVIGLWELARRRPWLQLISGAALALAAVIENGPYSVFFVMTAALAAMLVRIQSWKMPWAAATRRRMSRFWWGFWLILLVWGVVMVWPARADFLRMLDTPLAATRFGHVAQNLFMAPTNFWQFIRWAPMLVLLAHVYMLVFARSLFGPIARHREISEIRAWFFAWLITAPVFVAMRQDRPMGLMVMMLPPVCLAAAEALTLLLRATQVKKPQIDIMVVLGILALSTWFAVQVVVHSLVTRWHAALPPAFFQHQFRFEFLLVMAIATPLTILVASLWLRWKHFTVAIAPAAAMLLVISGIGAVLASDVAAWGAIYRAGRSLPEAAATMRSLPRGSVVGGSWAPTLGLDGGFRGVVLWPGMNDRRPIETLGITHLLLQQLSSESIGANRALDGETDRLRNGLTPLPPVSIGRVTLDLFEVGPVGPVRPEAPAAGSR